MKNCFTISDICKALARSLIVWRCLSGTSSMPLALKGSFLRPQFFLDSKDPIPQLICPSRYTRWTTLHSFPTRMSLATDLVTPSFMMPLVDLSKHKA